MDTKAVIFDFDYTLADSSRGVEKCINYALEKLGMTHATYMETSHTIGLSLTETLVALKGEEARKLGPQFRSYFQEAADRVMADNTKVFSYVPGVLKYLEGKYMLSIVSTKYRYRITNILERESLFDYFKAIVGGEDVASHKPDPESILKALSMLGLDSSEALYVGDSVTDAAAARNAGVPFTAVLSGVTSSGAFQPYPCVRIVPDVSHLMKFL